MTLTVEDGTGLSDADALDSLANVKARLTKMGRDVSVYTDEQFEQAIRRASDWLSSSFDWQGYRIEGRNQALAFPRYNMVDEDGWAIDSDSVPEEVLKALSHVTWQEVVTPFSMTPVVTPINQKVLVQVDGIKWQAMGRSGVNSSVPVLTAIQNHISALLKAGSGNALAGSAVRG